MRLGDRRRGRAARQTVAAIVEGTMTNDNIIGVALVLSCFAAYAAGQKRIIAV